MKKRMFLSIAATAALLGAATVATPAMAHHSGASFDRSKPITVTGKLKVFQWANPHVWMDVEVPNGKGGVDIWRLEGPSVSILARNGWKRSSVSPGETLRLLVAPNRDGSKGGEFLTVKKADGTFLQFGVI